MFRPTEQDYGVHGGTGQRLGVSARTVSRRMASIMERLGAASRFEAGIRATQQGWL